VFVQNTIQVGARLVRWRRSAAQRRFARHATLRLLCVVALQCRKSWMRCTPSRSSRR
jgi:hypothetical protein